MTVERDGPADASGDVSIEVELGRPENGAGGDGGSSRLETD